MVPDTAVYLFERHAAELFQSWCLAQREPLRSLTPEMKDELFLHYLHRIRSGLKACGHGSCSISLSRIMEGDGPFSTLLQLDITRSAVLAAAMRVSHGFVFI